MNTYPKVTDADVAGKRVLLRAGFDVPMKNGEVVDQSRIEAIVPTITLLREAAASVIILAHQGRPKGVVDPELSQQPLQTILSNLLGTDVGFVASCVGEEVRARVDALAPGDVLLLENLRFDPREKKNDPAFAEELAALGDVYVNDAFPNCHRAHASMDALPRLLPSYMGLKLQQEVEQLSGVLDNPTHPVCLIASGAKIETKLPLITHFRDIGDSIVTGGVMANTFLAASGKSVGLSLVDEGYISTASDMLRTESEHNARFVLPVDVVVAADRDANEGEVVLVDAIPDDMAAFDLGPKTAEMYAGHIAEARTIVWNGPLGLYQQPAFAAASKAVAEALRDATKNGATTIVGGGDTIDCIERVGCSLSDYTFVSTGGGAMLDLLSGKTLPGLAALLHRAE